MLEDVGQVRAFAQALEEAARYAARALVLVQRREKARQPLDEVGEVGGGDVLESPEGDVACNHRREAPVVRPPQGANACYAKVVWAKIRREVGGAREWLGHRG